MVTHDRLSQGYPTLRIERVAQATPLRTKGVKIEVRGYAALRAV